MAKSDPFLITSFKRVPNGTNGGVTLVGTFFSMVGGTVIGLSQYLATFYFSDKASWDNAPPQWPLILFGAFAGFFGSLVDSLMGATLQYSGKRTCITVHQTLRIILILVILYRQGRLTDRPSVGWYV